VYEIVYIAQSRRVAISPQRAFGDRVRALRTAAGLTQEELAEHCGLFRTYLSRIETGVANPTLTMIYALAASLGVTVIDMFPNPPVPSPRSAAKRAARGRVIK